MVFLNNPIMGRTIATTFVKYVHQNDKKGVIEDEITLYGNFTPARAEKFLQKKLKQKKLFVTDIEKKKNFYEVYVQDFVNLAQKTKEKG